MPSKFNKQHYEAFVDLVKIIRKEVLYNKQGNSIVEVKALEDYLSIMFAKDNPNFRLDKFRKALGRTDY